MRTIKFSVAGSGLETDAPSVEDLLDQIRDYFDILSAVESAVAGDNSSVIEWRIVSASKNSPLLFEFAPYAKQYAVNIDARVELVVRNTARGLSGLKDGGQRPPYFSEKTLAKAERLFERVTNGLATTEIDYGSDLPSVRLTRVSASAAASNVKRILTPPPKSYTEIGSVEGTTFGFDRDGWGHHILKIRLRMTGDEINCRLNGQALHEVEIRRVGEIWKNSRIQLYGTIFYKALGKVSRVDGRRIRFLRGRDQLPTIDEIQDEGFTNGKTTETYLEGLRDG